MKITGIAIVPPAEAEHFPKVTPELLASVLAKYSRSNEGIHAILGKVDLTNPQRSIAQILKFVDYGHASIGGLTGGIAVAIDNVTMFAAYQLFAIAPHGDGQESSTRYIRMDETSLPNWTDLGFSDDQAEIVDQRARHALVDYNREYARLDELAAKDPTVVRYPEKANDKMRDRIRKNFALDRARYFLPFALKTNVAMVQTARAWTETISGLLSHPSKELQELGNEIKTAVLAAVTPNLIRHAAAKPGWQADHLAAEAEAVRLTSQSFGEETLDRVEVEVLSDHRLDLSAGLSVRQNRYDRCSRPIRAASVAVRWNNMAIAEIRDLNRHRTGHRFSPLAHIGMYLPKEIAPDPKRDANYAPHYLSTDLFAPSLRPYTLFLGSQTPFEQTTQLDKFIYQAELRTGPGAHYRYADHMRQAVAKLGEVIGDDNMAAIQLGEAEPE